MNRQKSKPRLAGLSNDSAGNNPSSRNKQIHKLLIGKRSEATPVPSRPPSRQPTHKRDNNSRNHKNSQSKGKSGNKPNNSALLMKKDLKQLIGKKGSARGKPTDNVPQILKHIEKNCRILRDLHQKEQQSHRQTGQKRSSQDGKHSQPTNRSQEAVKKMQKQRQGEKGEDKKKQRVLAQSTRLSLDCHKQLPEEHNIIEVFKYYKMAFGGQQSKQTKPPQINPSRSSSMLHGPSVNVEKIQEIIRNQQQMMKEHEKKEKKERQEKKRSERIQKEWIQRERKEVEANVENGQELKDRALVEVEMLKVPEIWHESVHEEASFCMQSLRPLQPEPTPNVPPHRHIPLPEDPHLSEKLLLPDPHQSSAQEAELRFAQSKYYVRPIPGKEDSLLGCEITLIENSQQRWDSDLPDLDL